MTFIQVGNPISVTKHNEPSMEEVMRIQAMYIAELTRSANSIRDPHHCTQSFSQDMEYLQGSICAGAISGAKYHRLVNVHTLAWWRYGQKKKKQCCSGTYHTENLVLAHHAAARFFDYCRLVWLHREGILCNSYFQGVSVSVWCRLLLLDDGCSTFIHNIMAELTWCLPLNWRRKSTQVLL